eukprot:5485932-Amphidinium_carterae.1
MFHCLPWNCYDTWTLCLYSVKILDGHSVLQLRIQDPLDGKGPHCPSTCVKGCHCISFGGGLFESEEKEIGFQGLVSTMGLVSEPVCCDGLVVHFDWASSPSVARKAPNTNQSELQQSSCLSP